MTSRAEQSQTPRNGYTLHVPFSEIREAGCYVSNTNGNLLRIPPEALTQGHSPVIEIVSKEGAMTTKVCDDPWTPINKCRQLAADADLYVNF